MGYYIVDKILTCEIVKTHLSFQTLWPLSVYPEGDPYRRNALVLRHL